MRTTTTDDIRTIRDILTLVHEATTSSLHTMLVARGWTKSRGRVTELLVVMMDDGSVVRRKAGNTFVYRLAVADQQQEQPKHEAPRPKAEPKRTVAYVRPEGSAGNHVFYDMAEALIANPGVNARQWAQLVNVDSEAMFTRLLNKFIDSKIVTVRRNYYNGSCNYRAA